MNERKSTETTETLASGLSAGLLGAHPVQVHCCAEESPSSWMTLLELMDSGVTGLCESLDVEKGSSFSTFNLIETLKHLSLWAHGRTCIFKYQSDTFSCFQKEKWTGEGRQEKAIAGGVGRGRGGRGIRPEQGIWSFCGLFW